MARTGIRTSCTGRTVKAEIHLTSGEERIFATLLGTARAAGLNTTLRVAGGWVRDKVLGEESDDIDVALDDIVGKAFAEHVNDYLRSRGEETHGIGVIMQNPDQSKHLETATMQVHGQFIDFVNLRTETYTAESRIPEASFGSPREDAFRRDLTINALFYNINSKTVEDYTGNGLADLEEGIVRTPLPPRETFLDDPLRVLRSVRFAARFGFTVDPELQGAASSEDVRHALQTKVSRERVGTELDGMLKGPNPAFALCLMKEMKILDVLFGLENERMDPPAEKMEAGGFGTQGEAMVAAVSRMLPLLGSAWFPSSKAYRRNCYLCALLIGMRGHVGYGKKSKPVPLTHIVVLDKLKLSKKDCELVTKVHAALLAIREVRLGIMNAGERSEDGLAGKARVAAGLVIRELKELWPMTLLLSSLIDYYSEEKRLQSPDVLERCARECTAVSAAVEASHLGDVWNLKPLVSGKEIMKELGQTTGGPWLGKATGLVMEWQLMHPEGSLEDCRLWISETLRTELEL